MYKLIAAAAGAAFAVGVTVGTAVSLGQPVLRDEPLVLPTEVTRPSYTPFTHVPIVRPSRPPHPRSIYTPSPLASPGR